MTRRPVTPGLALLLAHAVLVQVVSYAMRPAVSYAIVGAGPEWLGVATAAFAVPPLLLAIPSGRLADRLGERVPLVLGAAAFLGACVVALAWGATLVGLVATSMLLGVGVLLSVIGEQAWVMRDAPPLASTQRSGSTPSRPRAGRCSARCCSSSRATIP